MATLHLTHDDQSMLDGEQGGSLALAMRVLVAVAKAMGAEVLLDITGAHIDGCLYQGPVGLDFVSRIAADGGQVRVPTTLNVGSLDLLHPEVYRVDPVDAAASRQLMHLYESLGCRPTWTCAPYHDEVRPNLGEQVAWAESNAIVFANSVLGARTHRYGDFIDICAAMTGRAPAAGLHLTENRRGQIVFDVASVSSELRASDVLFPVLGHVIGAASGKLIPVIVGLEAATEDQLKALGATAAAAGAVGMFHAVGITPEAPDLDTALGGEPALQCIDVTSQILRRSRDELTTAKSDAVGAVSVGTPHASYEEIVELVELIAGRRCAVEAYVSTGRATAERAASDGLIGELETAGFTLVTDTCTYITPIIRSPGSVMTNSGKWAYYAPANLGVPVHFGSLGEVVESAVAGRVVRNEALWR
ncbi:MAG: DUF521 domain-containing protein [Acidimicrobiia bacterium]|nr:DUF521 domain-containing protein [Acidimicrobiia bacterium]